MASTIHFSSVCMLPCAPLQNTPGDKRAQAMATTYDCALQASTNYYSDWAAMYLAPRTLVMAASTYVYFQVRQSTVSCQASCQGREEVLI